MCFYVQGNAVCSRLLCPQSVQGLLLLQPDESESERLSLWPCWNVKSWRALQSFMVRVESVKVSHHINRLRTWVCTNHNCAGLQQCSGVHKLTVIVPYPPSWILPHLCYWTENRQHYCSKLSFWGHHRLHSVIAVTKKNKNKNMTPRCQATGPYSSHKNWKSFYGTKKAMPFHCATKTGRAIVFAWWIFLRSWWKKQESLGKLYIEKKKKDEREWKKPRWNNSDWTGHIHLMESAPVLWQSVFPRWDVFPLHTWVRYGSKQAFFLPHQWVTKPANLLVQQSVLLCGISRSNWDSCGKFFARLLIVTMLLTLSSDNSNSRGSSFKSRCEFEIKLLFISNSNRNQTLFCFHSFNSHCDW